MTTLHTGAAFAAAGGNGQALFDFAPWWVKLIVGVIMVAIALILHRWGSHTEVDGEVLSVVKGLFGILGLLVIFYSLGIF